MVTDSRGHQVPAGSDSWGYREDMEQLSASITDVRSVADQAAATAAVADLDAADLDTEGTVWWLQSPGTLVVYTSGEFVPVAMRADFGQRSPIVAYGMTSVTGKAVDTRKKTVTYPTGLFPGTPMVMLQNLTGFEVGGVMNQTQWPSNRSTSSFQINVSRGNTTAVSMAWLAVYYNPPANTSLQTDSTTDVLAAEPDSVVVCPTDGCPNQGIAIEVTTTSPDDETGEQVPVDAIECGVCGTDLTDTAREA